MHLKFHFLPPGKLFDILTLVFSFFQYFVFDFHMAPAMLFDKIITLTVSKDGMNTCEKCKVYGN